MLGKADRRVVIGKLALCEEILGKVDRSDKKYVPGKFRCTTGNNINIVIVILNIDIIEFGTS